MTVDTYVLLGGDIESVGISAHSGDEALVVGSHGRKIAHHVQNHQGMRYEDHQEV